MVGSYSLTDSPYKGDGEDSHPLISYGEVFEKHCPYYLSIGMTADEYWNGPNDLPKYYREAEIIRRKRHNEEMYIMGAYIYDTMLRVAPAYRDFVRRGTKPKEFMKEPFDLFPDNSAKKKEEKAMSGVKNYMDAFMVKHNAKMKRDEEGGK